MRVAKSMITFSDALDMVSIEGYSAKKPIPNNKKCMTKSEVNEYLNCSISGTIASNQLVRYERIQKAKTFLSSNDGFSSSALSCSYANTETTRYYEGVGAYPALGETVYRDNNYNVFVGLNLWYFTLSGFSIKINNSGVIRDVQSCE